jgi:sugar/nucleoside kinase (ribokinase family)
LRALGPDVALIAIKCGADGVIGHAAGSPEFIEVPAVPVELVDATGGGDSFCGGVLAGFTQTHDLLDALLSGVVSASFCVEGLGLEGLVAATREAALSRVSTLRERVTFHAM